MAAQTPYLYREIHAQPAVLATLLAEEAAHIARFARYLRDHPPCYVVIAARGSSDNAALYAKYLFASAVGWSVALATPSLFTLYHRPPRLRQALVIGISQSGRSTDIVAVVEEARRQGAMTLGITNDSDSPLAQAAHEVIRLRAGEERSIAATKTYTAQLMVMALLVAHLADVSSYREALPRVPEAVETCLQQGDYIQQMAERYRYMHTCVVIGRGYNYATAYEFALKMKELTYVVAEPYSSADFQHGPIAVVADGFPVFLLAPQGKVHPEIHALGERLRARRAELVVFSDVEATVQLGRVSLQLPVSLPEWLSPITTIVPAQLFTYYLTLAKDYDPDHPRGLTKVTQTR